MRKIIISYRRADSDAIAGRIRDRLASHFGETSIFMDIDSIPFGTDFRDYIRDALFDSDVLVAVVGPKWLGPGKGAHLRIKEENDPIRIEVETALDRGIAVIPVLVNGALMPKPSELPSTLANFAFRNAAEVDSGRDFHPHMDRLMRSIDQILLAKGKAAAATSSVSAPNAVADAGSTTAEAARAAEPAEPKREPPPAPVAAALVSAAAAGVTQPPPVPLLVQPVPPSGKPKAAASVIALAAAGAAFVVAAVGIAIWFYGRPAPQVTPPVTQQTQVAPQPQVTPQPQPTLARPTVVAAGCPGTPAFHDDFKTVDPGWDLDGVTYVDGQIATKAAPDTYGAAFYRSLIYKNATICLDVKTPTAMNNTVYGGGLVFWATDSANFYYAKITSDGRYRISRKYRNDWWTVVPLTKFEGLKQGYGVVNSIKVTTAGNVATVYLNDRKVYDIKGQPPRSGGSIGMLGEFEKEQSSEWRFLDIAVIELPASQTIAVPPSETAIKAMLDACKLGRSAVFADDFKVNDPSWNGLDDNTAYYSNDRLVIKPIENKVDRVLNLSLFFKDITICGDLISPAQIKAENDTAGGIIFWATGEANNYYAMVFPDGSYSISRRVDRQIVSVVPKTSIDAVKKGPGAQNRLKLVLSNTLGTLYINDVKVREFRGQPPPNGSSIGLYAESEAGQRTEWGFAGIIVVEPQ